MKVDFLNLHRQYLSIQDEIDDAIKLVLASSAFSGGQYVDAFEREFAKLHQADYCVAVHSGTAALHVVLMALEIGPGDEVIVPTNTFFASAEAVSLAGATPVFVDCGLDDYNINPDLIEAAITPKTKGIIAVHLYGQPAKLDTILSIAQGHDIFLIEDCAQAHCAQYNGNPVGTFGIAGCFSFYPGKNMGAYGEGGAVILNDKALYNKLLALRNHGSHRKYYHDYVGHNYRMDGFQGAILNVKIRYIHQWTDARRNIATLYREYLKNISEIVLPQEMANVKHVYHLFIIQTKNREQLIEHLASHSVTTGIHYPVPCHLQNAYKGLNYQPGSLPVSEMLADTILSLPIFPELEEEEVVYVCNTIKNFYSHSSSGTIPTLKSAKS